MPPSIVVSGAGPGLGRAVARRYARAGYTVVLVARRQAPLEELAADLAGTQGHGKVAFMQPEAALACAADRGDGDGWRRLCCRGRPSAGG